MKKHKKLFSHRVRKYCRWLRLYLIRVKTTENQIGGELNPC